MCFKIALELHQMSLVRISRGSAFQSLAEATENDLKPYLVSL